MAVTVLVIEDEERILSFVRKGLEAEGYQVVSAWDGNEGLAAAMKPGIDLVILDLKLPSISGEEIVASVRRRRPDLPVIVLTAKDAVSDKVAALNAGADDYVTKPFSFAELLARVRARLRPRGQRTTMLVVGGVTLDLLTRQAAIGGREVGLTAREFSLLETLMRHAGQVLSETQLLDLVWGYHFDPGSNVVEVYIGYLRKKLRPDVIETVRGAGYRLVG